MGGKLTKFYDEVGESRSSILSSAPLFVPLLLKSLPGGN